MELSDLYHENGRAFGMIRTGKTFVKTHKGHPRHKELMLKLLDAYLVTSRNDDIVSTSRQFLEFYGKDAAAPRVARELAVLLNRLGKRDETAKAYEHAWKLAGVKDLNSAFEAVRLYGGNRGAQFAVGCPRKSSTSCPTVQPPANWVGMAIIRLAMGIGILSAASPSATSCSSAT